MPGFGIVIVVALSFPRQNDKSSTPGLKSTTPTPRNDAPTPGTSSTPGLRPILGKPPGMEALGWYHSFFSSLATEINHFSILSHCTTVMSHTNILLLSLYVAAPALRTPLSIASSYPTPFAMMGHHEMNGGLTSPSVYAGLHISPQMSVAAAAAYGRSPMVTLFPLLLFTCIT